MWRGTHIVVILLKSKNRFIPYIVLAFTHIFLSCPIQYFSALSCSTLFCFIFHTNIVLYWPTMCFTFTFILCGSVLSFLTLKNTDHIVLLHLVLSYVVLIVLLCFVLPWNLLIFPFCQPCFTCSCTTFCCHAFVEKVV